MTRDSDRHGQALSGGSEFSRCLKSGGEHGEATMEYVGTREHVLGVVILSVLLAACSGQAPMGADGGVRDAGIDAGTNDGGLADAGYDGGPITLSSSGGGSIALTDSTVFFTDPGIGVLSVPRAGGPTILLYEKTSEFEIPDEIAVDAAAVYWTDFNGRVLKLTLATSELSVLATPYQPNGLKLRNGRLYWASSIGLVGFSAVDGSDQGTFDVGLGTVPSELDVDDSAIYVVDIEGPIGHEKIIRVDLDSGAATVLADAQNYAGQVVVDDQYVYWGVGGDDGGSVLAIAKDGGAIQTLASSPLAVAAIALDAGVIYFSTFAHSQATVPDQAIFWLDRTTQVTTPLATDLYYPIAVEVGSDGIYWGEQSRRVAKLPY